MAIDPTKIHVESHSVPIWEQEESFQEVLAAQLKNAPWLGLSLLLHGLVALIVASIPPSPPKLEQKAAQMEMPKPEEKIEEEVKPEEKIEEEKPPENPQMQDSEVVETNTNTENTGESNFEDPTATDNTGVQSAFDGNAWNTAVGLGGGAAGKFGGRKGGRKGLVKGGKSTAEAIEAGLEWLKKHQDEDGKWDADEFMKHDKEGEACKGAGNPVHDVGLTGLALLAFLGDGSTMRSGPYREVIKKAVTWLKDQQQENGLFGMNASHDFIYDHAIATYAMCEAYGLSDYKLLRPYAQNGLNYLESHRNPYMVWRYQPRDNDNDTSVTGWAVMAYKSAADFKLVVNKDAFKLCETWLDQVTDPSNGRHGYTKRGEASSRHPGDHATRFPTDKGEAMTAVGLLCRFFLGQDPKDQKYGPAMNAAANLILSKPPKWNEKDGSIDQYYWYYASYALFQMGGRHWTEWSKAMTEAIVKPQRKDGNYKGSWDPEFDVWGEDGGRVFTTAISVLTLEAYYRYTKLIR